MSAYNCVRYDFVNGQSQFRFYKNPISVKEYMFGEKSKAESDRIDRKIENHVLTEGFVWFVSPFHLLDMK
jgi:hypothetical protein